MIAIDRQSAPLSAMQRYALDVVLDLSRVLRFAGQEEDVPRNVVRLRVVDADAPPIGSCVARGWTIEHGDGVVTVTRGALQRLGEVVGAVAEQRSGARDRWQRVPSSANVLVAASLDRLPVASVAATMLRGAVTAAAGRRPVRILAPWPRAARWAVALTHDLDVVAHWPVFTALRLAELARKGEFGQALAVSAAATRSVGTDPVGEAVRTILDTERTHAVRSTWFVLCGTPTFATRRVGDLTYRPESPSTRAILRVLGDDRHEIGLHGSFETYEDVDRLRAQRERLSTLTPGAPRGVRQHYVRMRPGGTQAAMSEAGFAYDATYGFPDRNGFRLGVADVVPMWSDAEQRVLPIVELPFVWMDRALSKYQGVEHPDEWVHDALALAAIVREHDGVWSGIWHPNLTPALGYPGAPAAYRALVNALAEHGPWFATASEIVDWRAARRDARASALDSNGAVVFTSSGSASRELALEDARGALTTERTSA